MSYAHIAQGEGCKTRDRPEHRYSIQQKLRIGTMQGLVLWCVRNGLLDNNATDDGWCFAYTGPNS